MVAMRILPVDSVQPETFSNHGLLPKWTKQVICLAAGWKGTSKIRPWAKSQKWTTVPVIKSIHMITQHKWAFQNLLLNKWIKFHHKTSQNMRIWSKIYQVLAWVGHICNLVDSPWTKIMWTSWYETAKFAKIWKWTKRYKRHSIFWWKIQSSSNKCKVTYPNTKKKG